MCRGSRRYTMPAVRRSSYPSFRREPGGPHRCKSRSMSSEDIPYTQDAFRLMIRPSGDQPFFLEGEGSKHSMKSPALAPVNPEIFTPTC